MDIVGIAEIESSISTLVKRVSFGRERIILTSRGKPKAALISIEDLEKLEALDRTPPSLSRAQRRASLAMAQAVREMTLARRGGVPFDGVADDLSLLREGRDLYLALAEILGLDLWTADEHLYNAVRHELPWVKWLGDYQP